MYIKNWLSNILIGSIFTITIIAAYPVGNSGESIEYLTRFGYLRSDVMGDLDKDSAAVTSKIQDGLKNFQYFAGIPRTGILDAATMKAINLPRCGNSELDRENLKRQRRFVLDSKWEKIFITYKILNLPSSGPNRTIISELIQTAFEYWSNETNIHIHSVKNDVEQADIEISWVRGAHNDGIEFDEIQGVGRVIAHAWKPFNADPLRGDMHFNDAVTWSTSNSNPGDNDYDLLRTAIHEAGHSLGLEHSPHQEAVMYFAVTNQPNLTLSRDDKLGIQGLYGIKQNIRPLDGKEILLDRDIKPPIVPSGTPKQNIPWACYRYQDQNPGDVEGTKMCYQNFYRDFYISLG